MTGLDAGLDRLLHDAAMALLVEKGVASLRFGQIDRRAGVPAGTCLRRYGSRAKLVASLLEAMAGRFQAELRAVFDRNRGDPVGAVMEWLTVLLGPSRDRTRAAWALLLDTGLRPQVTMYADALQAGWERQVAIELGSTREEIRVIWPMIEGWVGVMLIRDRPMPEPGVLAAYVRTLLCRPETCPRSLHTPTAG